MPCQKRLCISAGHVQPWDTRVVPERCTCGAQLPPDALFCHKCGKPQREDLIERDIAGGNVSDAAGEAATPEPATSAALPRLADLPPFEIGFSNRTDVRTALFAG